MRYFFILTAIVLFLMALGFAMKNADPVTLHYYLGFAWHAPLVLVLLIALCFGALAGILACLPLIVQQRRQLLALRRKLNAAENQ